MQVKRRFGIAECTGRSSQCEYSVELATCSKDGGIRAGTAQLMQEALGLP